MLLAPFNYAVPESLDEAIALLKENEGAQILAGGQSILTEMRLHHISPSMLVDLRKIQALHSLKLRSDGSLRIGAMMPFVEIAEDLNVQENYPLLVEAIKSTRDSQVRNCRTIGGTLAFNATGADLPAVVLALDATLTLSGPQGTHTLPATEFDADSLQTGPLKGAIITSVDFPSVAVGSGSAYEKFKNRASDYALCGVATSVTLAPDGTMHDCRVAVTGVASHAMRLNRIEAAVNGQQATTETIAAASQVDEEVNCISDLAASAEYRTYLIKMLTEYSLTRSITQARQSL